MGLPPSFLQKLIIYKNGLPVDVALVDAVVLIDDFVGSRRCGMRAHTPDIVTRGQLIILESL